MTDHQFGPQCFATKLGHYEYKHLFSAADQVLSILEPVWGQVTRAVSGSTFYSVYCTLYHS